MTKDEAEEILQKAYELEDKDCSCHINPPCGKCENMPSDEMIEEAQKLLERGDK